MKLASKVYAQVASTLNPARRASLVARAALAVAGLSLGLGMIAIPEANAAQDPAGWVGGLFGIAIPNKDNTTARPIYGITAGAKLGSEWGIGAYYLNSQKDEDILATKTKFNLDLYGVEFAYHFEGEARGVYLGGRVGMSKVTLGTASTSPTHFGAVAGYNHFLGDNFSIGGDLSLLQVQSSSTTPTPGVTVAIDSFTTLNFMASAKLWF